MEWASVIISLLGISWFIFCIKWLLSRNFREARKRNIFKHIREETDDFNDYVNDSINVKEPWQLQNATNQYLGTGKLHHSLITKNFKKTWNFRDKVRDFNFASSYIEQNIENENAQLTYKYKMKTIKWIERFNIWFSVLVTVIYVLVIIFEILLLNSAIESLDFTKQNYTNFKLTVLTIFVILLPFSAYCGSKASVALSLKDTFDIREKNDEN